MLNRGRCHPEWWQQGAGDAPTPQPQTPLTTVNAFARASLVEHRGIAVLLPYLEERAYRGQIVTTTKGALSRALQRHYGDFFINVDAETVRSLEIKVELVSHFESLKTETP